MEAAKAVVVREVEKVEEETVADMAVAGLEKEKTGATEVAVKEAELVVVRE